MALRDRTDRRTFIGQATMALASAGLDTLGVSAKQHGLSRELTALTSQSSWLNSPPLGAGDVRGQVVIVDFCTYCCINWLRTLPSLRAWWQRYQGALVMVGVHTPEFGFEHDVGNVKTTLRQLNVAYPIVLDNDYRIWRAFRNSYWPALYFVDARGRVRNHHFGESNYGRWDRLIERMLAETGGERRAMVPPAKGSGVESEADWSNLRSPETYVGSDRMQNFASPGGASGRRRSYRLPRRLRLNEWALESEWTIGGQAAVLQSSPGKIAISFHARDLHLVMGRAADATAVRFRVTIDGRPPGRARGSDLDALGAGVVDEPRLYQLVRQQAPIKERLCEDRVSRPRRSGLRLYFRMRKITMRRRFVSAAVAAQLLLSACHGGPTAPTESAIVTFEVVGEVFHVELASARQIAAALAAQAGGPARIPSGRIVAGTGANQGWSWHLEDVEFAEVTIELCDGRPSDVEKAGPQFGGGRFCPWSARVLNVSTR